MAIVDGKRVLGLHFYKVKGRNEWMAHKMFKHSGQWFSELIGTVVEVDTREDPRLGEFHYCSIVPQSIFFDSSFGRPNLDALTPSSWRKIPGGWRAAFRDALGLPEVAEAE